MCSNWPNLSTDLDPRVKLTKPRELSREREAKRKWRVLPVGTDTFRNQTRRDTYPVLKLVSEVLNEIQDDNFLPLTSSPSQSHDSVNSLLDINNWIFQWPCSQRHYSKLRISAYHDRKQRSSCVRPWLRYWLGSLIYSLLGCWTRTPVSAVQLI